MYPRVTAIVVARNGGEHLTRTLDALKAQSRQPDVVVAVMCSASDDSAAVLANYSLTQIVSVREPLPFGAAVATGLRSVGQAVSDHEWLWLLAQDTAPEPRALEMLLAAVEVSPSVAVAGPKLVDWNEPSTLRGLGEAMTPLGASVPLVEDELDQAQHDGLSDVLAVAPGGMLVRHTLWERLGGFDPGLPLVDDGLDFCVRVRLAGSRVVLVPAARVGFAADGVAGPSRSTKGRNRRRLFRVRRAAQLHRRMAYAPAAAVPLHWLSLVPLAIARSLARLVRKEPGAIIGELAAAFATAFNAVSTSSARRAIARSKVVGFAAVKPLRIPHAEERRARALKREAALLRYRGEKKELRFFSGGGVWVVLVMAVIGVALSVPLLGTSVLTGGSLLPLSGSVAALWDHVGYGWRDIGLGFVGAADPFSAVLAVLGSLTFWQPSFSLTIVWIAALPLAALGAWIAASRVTDRMGLRATAAVVWALAPSLLLGLQTGRPSAALVHLLLPWLFFAGVWASRSWAAAATTAILAAATLACAPSLGPALIVLWIVSLVLAGRHIARLIVMPLPALALFAPLVWQQGAAGNWLALMADPAVPLASNRPHAWELVSGFPDASLGGWAQFLSEHSLSGLAPVFIVPILLIPLGVLALLAMFLRGSARAMLSLGVALLGFLTAIAAGQLAVATVGSASVAVWAGAGLSLYWLGLVGAATIGLGALGRAALVPAWVVVVAVAVAITPAAISLPLGTTVVAGGDGRTLPAVVTADAATNPRIGTLRLTPQADGGIAAELLRGTGNTLDSQSTLLSTREGAGSGERALASLAGNLASQSGQDPSEQLSRLGIGFVLLAPAAHAAHEDPSREAVATSTRASTALTANAHLADVAETGYGALFSFDAGDEKAIPVAARIPPDAGGAARPLSLVVLGVIFGIFLLLALPTGRVTEFTEPRRGRPRSRAAASPKGSPPPDPVEPSVPSPAVPSKTTEKSDEGSSDPSITDEKADSSVVLERGRGEADAPDAAGEPRASASAGVDLSPVPSKTTETEADASAQASSDAHSANNSVVFDEHDRGDERGHGRESPGAGESHAAGESGGERVD